MITRLEMIKKIRNNLNSGETSIGTWQQIPHPSISEILGSNGFDWVAVDMEHGSVGVHQLPDLFRAIELGGSLPLARVAMAKEKDCRQALDAGAGGVIIPMIESADQLDSLVKVSCWPPSGNRGVGFSRANLFGKNFDQYKSEAQAPLIIAQIENITAVDNLDTILKVEGLDAIIIGPYDLSASLGLTGDFNNSNFKRTIKKIIVTCKDRKIPAGYHIVNQNTNTLNEKINEGYQFIAFSMDSVVLGDFKRFLGEIYD